MFLLTQVSGGALSTQRCSFTSAPKFTHPIPPLFSHRISKFSLPTATPSPLIVVNVAAGGGGGGPAATQSKPTTPYIPDDSLSFVGEESVPLEGVIQFEKPNSTSLLNKWGRVALLAGGDALALLSFSAIGRFSHGFSVFDAETLRTADPFIAGWFLSAYFLGGYGEDGQGMNGLTKGVIASAKSWSLGIPLGIIIRAATVGYVPQTNFILVTMGSTSILLIGWRTLLFSIFANDNSKKMMYTSMAAHLNCLSCSHHWYEDGDYDSQFLCACTQMLFSLLPQYLNFNLQFLIVSISKKNITGEEMLRGIRFNIIGVS